MFWAIDSADNKIGIIFYSIVLALFFVWVIHFREPFACVLKVEDGRLKIDYLFPDVKNVEIDLYKIEGDIVLKRYYQGSFAGGLPSWPEYINYRWYFTSEKYELEFVYNGEVRIFPLHTNIIGFKRFLRLLITSINLFRERKLKSIDNGFGKKELAIDVAIEVIKIIVAG